MSVEENNIEAYIEQNVTRVEIIWTQREFVVYWKFTASIQDSWSTLKIFVNNK